MKKLFMVLLLCGLSARAAQTKPNIVVFLADDHGQKDATVYGATDVRTPFMEKLASEGMVFDDAFIASPACGPSRAALMSGLMPARNGAEANHTMPRPEAVTMVRQLQANGYEVVAFGKVAHGKQSELCGFDRHDDNSGSGLAMRVKAFLDGRTSDKPLCLMVGDRRPHVPWTKQTTYDPAKVVLPSYFIDTKETREHRARYLTDITGMDAEMGKVDKLACEAFGTNNYIFAYSADHGAQWPFGKWNLYDAGIRVPLIIRWPGHVKAGVRTAAMVSWIDLMPTLIDLSGGLVPEGIDGCSFADVLLGQTNHHRDVACTTHSGDSNMNVYPIRAIRTDRFKYIRNLRPDCYHSNHSDIQRKDGAGAYWDSWDAAAKTNAAAAAIVAKYYQRPAEELYDLEKDPTEQHNLAGNPEYQAQMKKMGNMLDGWMKEQGDTQKVFNEPYPAAGPLPVDVHAAKAEKTMKAKKKKRPQP